mmetsp:Transcript_8045/g.29874  ORF Transcript_8045/g.29874 Transcript_8045/m.29874 type:complete len:233 (-) Transcript_8045:479-1177(-)
MPATTTTTTTTTNEHHDSDHHHHLGHHDHEHHNHEHDDLDPNHTFRDYEQRALTMAIVILIIGFLILLGAIGFTSWAWAFTPLDFNETGPSTSQFVLAIVVSAIHFFITLCAIIAGIVAILWFSFWICGDKPKGQRFLIALLALLFLFIAVLYFIVFLIGIALFVVRLTNDDLDNEIYNGWFGALTGFLFSLKFFGLAVGAKYVCRPRLSEDHQDHEDQEYSRRSIRRERHA